MKAHHQKTIISASRAKLKNKEKSSETEPVGFLLFILAIYFRRKTTSAILIFDVVLSCK